MTIDLKRVIPLLSGHLGGANELSVEITESLDGCVNFVTTANAVSIISYYVHATDKVLVNYVGNFA